MLFKISIGYYALLNIQKWFNDKIIIIFMGNIVNQCLEFAFSIIYSKSYWTSTDFMKESFRVTKDNIKIQDEKYDNEI
jgi:hypothetical protein